MLNDVWGDALRLRSSRDVWDELRPNLGDYGNVAGFVSIWFRDHLISGCRRLLDDGNDANSVVRALRHIAADADVLTHTWIVEHVPHHEEPAMQTALVGDKLAKLGCEANGVECSVIEETIQRLKSEYRHVTQLATRRIAHRLEKPVERVEAGHIDRLLDDVLIVAQDWYGLLGAVHLDTEAPRVSGTSVASLALRLFNHREYIEALSEATRRLGPTRRPGDYESLERDCSVEYRFGEAAHPTA